MSDINKTLEQLNQELAKAGIIIKKASDIKESPKIKTGIYALDYVLDGGIYWGEGGHRIEFYGKESSCKTTFTLFIIKKYQELGKSCLYINAEQSYDKEYGALIGIDNDKLIIVEPKSLEQAGDILVETIGKYDLIIVDSIPSLITQEELDGNLEENKYMASQAKVLSPMMRKLYSASSNSFTTIIFINQMREKVGIAYGNPNITPGGKALKHFYNTRIEFRLGSPLEIGVKENKERIGTEVILKCEKNKRGKPLRTALVDFYYDGNLDNRKSLLYAAIKFGIISQAASYYKYKDKKIQGEKAFVTSLTDDEWSEIETEIWKLIK